MSWREIERDDKFITWRCQYCRRLGTSLIHAQPPSTCVCSPAPRPKRRNTGGMKNQ